ncbi:MAG: tRNA dihydrouridine synthase DusB [Bdellovibrionaceae bacterium]|nr:tRNA dihydrouridine synthase DusB [Bdellovibrionales bacterium]MCB9085320.1 tRNA dihydrouridine synthase DusB [Pseudobdellovibrionaceae bacterium]
MTEKALLQYLDQNPFVLAPMAGISDCAFRSFMRELNCGVVVSELVSANGLFYDSQKTRNLMAFAEDQRPVGIQLFGDNLDSLAAAAKEVEGTGADFVDLNFGCPVPKVVKKGAGSAVLKDLTQLAIVLRTVKRAISIPLTIKIRTGWDESSKNTHDVVRIAQEEGVTWVAVHGRTRAAGYSGLADWDYISEVQAKTKMPIIGNGDIRSSQQAVQRLQSSGCRAVMIGRGCLKNPWIFRQSLALFRGEQIEVIKDFLWVLDRLKFYLQKYSSDRIVLIQLKKFSAWFSAGYPNSAQFRRDLFSSTSVDEIYGRAQTYFVSIQHLMQADTSHEPFLMGGHG